MERTARPDDDPDVEITADVVAALVGEQFPPWRDRPVTAVVPGGWDNRTFRLGDELLVRLPSRAGYVPQVSKEHRWLPFLAPRLPLPIPEPVALGAPGHGYPWPWSVYRWLEGEPACTTSVDDMPQLARDLASFLSALHGLDPTDGPEPGEHNFFRGGPVRAYDHEVHEAVAALGDRIDRAAVTAVWERALDAARTRPRGWIHGDVAAGNLLVRDGRLAAVLDFGCCGVGAPACDLTIAWTLFDGAARAAFRNAMGHDERTWDEARGWALWKALIRLHGGSAITNEAHDARSVIDAVLADGPQRS
jgi:aminoglycoside phosphotransferase (APT) family kinase protein